MSDPFLMGGATQQFKYDTKAEAFLTILSKDSGKIDAIFASAPVVNIKAAQSVDYTLNKGLNKDFIVSAFGDSPVIIHIQGMRILACSKGGESVEAWYNRVKLSSDNGGLSNRVTVGLSGGEAFTCVLIGCSSEQNSNDSQLGCSRYTLSLLGVRE